MAEMRYYEERPCEHDEMEPHFLSSDPITQDSCSGGSRREITVDYEAALDEFLTFGFVRPFPHDGFDRRQTIGEIVKPVINAALGRGDTRDE